MTKLPRIEVWNIDPHSPRSYERWVMTTDGIVTAVSSRAFSSADPADIIGLSILEMERQFDCIATRDDRISDS